MARRVRCLSIAVLVAAGVSASTAPAPAQEIQVIHSAGPLTDIWVNSLGDCQVRHDTDGSIFEVYPSRSTTGNCFTGVRVGDTPTTSRLTSSSTFIPVSQSPVTGAGTATDPYAITTVVDVPSQPLRLRDRTSYVVGDEAFRTDITLVNSSDQPLDVELGHAMDCYLGASDIGYGLVETSAGNRTTVACTKTVNNDPPVRVEAYVPIDGGNLFFEGVYYSGFEILMGSRAWPNGCQCASFVDNGMAIGWNVTVPAHGEVTRSHLTAFSPQGRIPDPPPQCRDTGTETPEGAPVAVDLTCDGIIEAREVLDPPHQGLLSGDPNTGTLTYTPAPGFHGTDTFTYRAVNSSGPSNEATATILVYAAPTPPTPPPPAPPDEPIPDVPDPGPLPPRPTEPATLTIASVDPAIPDAPTISVGLRCGVAPGSLCVGQIRAGGRKVPVVTPRRNLKRVRIGISRRLRQRLGGPCRSANVRISAVTFQPGGRAPRERDRTVKITTRGCRMPAVTG